MGLPRIQPLLREGSPPLPPSPDPLPQPRAPLRDPRRRSTRSGAGSHAPCKLPYPPPRPSPPLPPHPRTTAWSAGAGATSRRHPRAVQLARSARPPTGRRVARARRCGAPGCWCLSGSGGGGQVWYAPWPSRHDAVVPRHLCPPGLDRLLPPLPSPPPFPSPPRTPFAAAPPRFGTSPPPPAKPLLSPSPLSTDPRGGARPRELCMGMCPPQNLCCWVLVGPLTNGDTARKASVHMVGGGTGGRVGGRDLSLAAVDPARTAGDFGEGQGRPGRGGPTLETACDRSSSSQLTRAARSLRGWANPRKKLATVGSTPRSRRNGRYPFVVRKRQSTRFFRDKK